MPVVVVKLWEDKFVLWSTVSDGPTSPAMSEGDMKRELRSRGWEALEIDYRIRLADRHGTSMPEWPLKKLLSHNQAGPRETPLTLDAIKRQALEH